MGGPEPGEPVTATGRQAPGRPAVDVVVPFRGTPQERERLVALLRDLHLDQSDTLVVVDNGPHVDGAADPVVHAPEVPSSYFARNRGAELGSGEWLLFIDADVVPPPDLIELYFPHSPAPDVGLLAGAVHDEQPAAGERLSPTSRYTALKASMGQHNTMSGESGYAQTANCAVRRRAFEEIGGFRADIRSGGDADLCFRLRAAGWRLEGADRAAVTHRNRTTLRAMARQRARHGSGAAWLNRQHPGSFPPARSAGKVKWSIQQAGVALLAAARRDRDAATVAALDVVSHWAFELGRLLPNRSR